jgi:outer membrane protein
VMPLRTIRLATCLCVFGSVIGLGVAPARAVAPPSADRESPTTGRWLPAPGSEPQSSATCALNPSVPVPVTLLDVVGRAACASPRTQRAWAELRAQTAAVGASGSAYLPSANLTASAGRASKRTTFPSDPQFDSLLDVDYTSAAVNVTWILYDSGLRAANLAAARHLLNAVAASTDEALQETFLEAARTFNMARAFESALEAARSAEAASAQNAEAAGKLYGAGVGSLADKLQAETALAQAQSHRVKMEGEDLSVRGTLAMLMGLAPSTSLQLAPVDEVGDETDAASLAVEQLIADAVRTHPRLRALREQLESARSDVAAVKARGRPSIAFGASMEHSDTPIAVSTQREIDRTKIIGFELSVPLFDGGERRYRTRRAEAQVGVVEADLSDAERRVGLEVWKSYHSWRTGAANRKSVEALLKSASLSVQVARGRYRAGAGSMLELLKAQSDLAAAQQQRIDAILGVQDAKLQLASSLGRLGR